MFAYSGVVTRMALPQSEMSAHSSRCRGHAITGLASTSSTVTGLRSCARSLSAPCALNATAMRANCSGVEPYSYMCRVAIIPYNAGAVGP